MTAVLLANAAAAVFSWAWYTRAARFGEESRRATQTARSAATVSLNVSEFMGNANGLAVFVAGSARPEAATAVYAAVVGSDRAVDTAMGPLVSVAGADEVRRLWTDLRLVTYGWINAEAAKGGSPMRIRTDGRGHFRAGVRSDLVLPAGAQGLDEAGLRDAVRTKSEILRDGALRRVVRAADARAAAAAIDEDAARTLATNGTAGLLVLSLAVAVAASSWIYASIARPLEEARRFAATVAGGDLRVTMGRHASDEIGALTRSVEEMKDVVVHKIDVMREMAGAVLVTADGVAQAAGHAGEVAAELSDAEPCGLTADIADVRMRAKTLVSLAEQMLLD